MLSRRQKEIVDTVLRSDELPTLPVIASKLIYLMSQEETTLSDIANLVSRDVALSTKILKVSNSAFYSFPQQIGSIQQAVSILGINAVRSLVLSFSFLNIRKGKKRQTFDFKKFWQHSLASGVASKLIAGNVDNIDPEEAFLSGLLQNLGELIFARTFPEQYEQVLTEKSDDLTSQIAVEESIIGIDHCTLGHEIAKHWGLPDSIVKPLYFHHNPDGYDENNKNILITIKLVYLSDLLTRILYSDRPEYFHKIFRKAARKMLGFNNNQIEEIFDQVHIAVTQAGDYFDLKIKDTKSIQEILQEANIKLSLINLDYDQMNKQLINAKVELEKLAAELEMKNRILDNLANVDGLTNVFNHRYFQNILDQEIDRAKRHDTILSLLFIDIDHFKNINDTYGHQAGDHILREFCDCLKSRIRKYDTLARYGGEEFAIVLPSTNEEEAQTAAEKLRSAVEDTIFQTPELAIEHRVTASFGVSTAHPYSEQDFSKSEFISKADQALYEAKKQGRNIVVSWSPKKKWYSF